MAASLYARSTRVNLLGFTLTVFSTLLPVVSAQVLLQFGAGQLPTCAQGCTLLKQAQDACTPPQAAAASQQQYLSCFCQSAYLRTFYQTPNGVCDASCGQQSDLVQIQQWYTGLCKNGVATAATTLPSTTAPGASSSTTSAVTTVSPSPTTTVGDAATPNQSWISTHYQWVIFLVVLILAILFFSIGGVWLKRRLKRRQAQRRVGTFNSTVTTATMPGSAAGTMTMRSNPMIAAAKRTSSSRGGTPMEMAGGQAGAMRSQESGVGSTGSGSGSGSGVAKGKGQATVAEGEQA